MTPLRAIDICAGAGGWACAARDLPIRIDLAVDLWPVACRTYEINHPATQVLCADLRDPDVQERVRQLARGCDLVLGGIPCEWLSVYRALNPVGSAELAQQRATLDACLELVRAIAPTYWCLEDVPQITKELPILTPWSVIQSAQYSGQRRKRVFVGRFPRPARGHSTKKLADYVRPGPYRIGPRSIDRKPVLNRTFTRTESLAAPLDRKAPTVLSYSSRRDAEVLVMDERLPIGKRQMEWQEAAVLQGFPEDYVFFGSPSDVAKQIGRAIQIDTGRAILSAIVASAAAKEVMHG